MEDELTKLREEQATLEIRVENLEAEVTKLKAKEIIRQETRQKTKNDWRDYLWAIVTILGILTILAIGFS